LESQFSNVGLYGDIAYICNTRIAKCKSAFENLIEMKNHNGMRPQDIVVLLKIITMDRVEWRNIDIANSIRLSPSEVSEALNRCKIARLIDSRKKEVHKNSFREFLIYGLKYVFPVEPGAIVKGIPTAHSAYPIRDHIIGGENYVWQHAKGRLRGQAIEPLYHTIPDVIDSNPALYELLVVIDTLRVGRAREVQIARQELEKRI